MINDIRLVGPMVLIGTFLLTYFIIPKIIWIVNSRNLIDQPDHRSSHQKSTPTMAGFSFFLVCVMLVFVLKNWDADAVGINFVAGVTVVFAIGLKDDLVLSSPRAKVMGQLLAISFVLFCSCIEMLSLQGFLGIDSIHYALSYIFMGGLMLVIINSYNLIDGIDGLASMIGIVIFAAYAVFFFFIGAFFYFLLSLGFIGVLAAYLRFNFSSSKKIFMGDTGSLIIGFCIAFLTVKFISADALSFDAINFKVENKIIVAFSVLCIPLFDTLRVIGVRLLNNKNPFYPDRSHIHHVLIDSKLAHYKVSLFLTLLNIIVIMLFTALSFYFNSYQMVSFFSIFFLSFLVVFSQLKKNIKSKNSFKRIIKFVNFIF
ncbi:MAG: MraY family glycosyltransferase [Polaribacter sp.]|nr:MraY family glycosyltransferase [Polaribacter sp.]